MIKKVNSFLNEYILEMILICALLFVVAFGIYHTSSLFKTKEIKKLDFKNGKTLECVKPEIGFYKKFNKTDSRLVEEDSFWTNSIILINQEKSININYCKTIN